MKRGRRRKMFRLAARARAAWEAGERPRGTLQDIVTITVSASKPTSVSYGLPIVLSDLPPSKYQKVRFFRHWTELALAGFGTEHTLRKAKRWLKRRAWRRRKARRGW